MSAKNESKSKPKPFEELPLEEQYVELKKGKQDNEWHGFFCRVYKERTGVELNSAKQILVPIEILDKAFEPQMPPVDEEKK